MNYDLYNYNDLLGYAQNAGFSGDSANIAAAIAMAESGGDPYADNPNDPNGGSYGLTQINGIWPGAQNTLGNPQAAFDQMFTISQGGTNFNPWGAYTNNSYQQFLPSGSSGTGSCSGLPSWLAWLCTGSQAMSEGEGMTGNAQSDPSQTLGSTAVLGQPSLPNNLWSELGKFFSFITSGQGWERIGVIIIGLMLLTVAGFMLATKGFEGTIRSVRNAA